jgi:hypothetical protein
MMWPEYNQFYHDYSFEKWTASKGYEIVASVLASKS